MITVVSLPALEFNPIPCVAGTEIEVIRTPGHSPGSCCLYVHEAGVLFSGDTLFSGGPGATGRSFSDFLWYLMAK